MNLDQITAAFSAAYDRTNKAKESLAETQTKMFAAFTKELEQGPLARRSVKSPFPHWDKMTEKTRESWLKKHHPGYLLVDEHDGWLVLEEDPATLKHTHINRKNGMVYGRTRVEGKPGLDDETLRAENPELWERITVWPKPLYSMIQDVVNHYTALPHSHDALHGRVSYFLEKHGVQKVLKDFSDITDEDLMDLEDYLLPGSVSVRLVPPREAKPEDLEDHVEEEEL